MRPTANVTTTDLLKFAGLAFVLADHFGLFFAPGDDWWRVFGRLAAPIFFFLMGFAKTRTIPWSWFALGAILTALDVWTSDGIEDVTLNILFNFALIRLAMPWLEANVLHRRWGLAGFALFCTAMIPLAGLVLEYGAQGWLWALFGYVAREAIAAGGAQHRLRRNLLALWCCAVYAIVEIRDYEFDLVQAVTLSALVAALGIALIAFRRADALETSAPVARAFNWIGRRTLEIYAVTLFAMQLGGHLLDIGADEDADED
jgi:hypothetical protein